MGRNLRVGLPSGRTKLVTGGLFSVSRNPIYASLFPLIIGGGILAAHPVVWLMGVFTVLVHHRIILAEEKFLEKRFGEAWRRYARKVGRYF